MGWTVRDEAEDEEAAGVDLSTLAAMSEYSSTSGGAQASEPAVLLPPAPEHAMSHFDAPDPLRGELYWYALEQATQDPHPPESDLPPAELAAMHLVSDDGEEPRGADDERAPRIGDARVSEFMTRNVKSIASNASIAQVGERFAELALQHLPVTDGGRLVGMISSNDLLRLRIEPLRRSRRNGRLQARHLMQTAPATVRESASLREAAATLCEGSLHALPVVDGDQRLVGFVTSSDLIRLLAHG